jgi:hypothetical protein
MYQSGPFSKQVFTLKENENGIESGAKNQTYKGASNKSVGALD